MIKATQNEIKLCSLLKQKKYRIRENKCLIEGWRTLKQLIEIKHTIHKIFLLNEEELIKIPTEYHSLCCSITTKDLKKISYTVTPQTVLTIVETSLLLQEKYNFFVYLDDIKDPGNLGTIIRTCAAANVDGLVLSPNCCDIFNEKVIRSAMGLIFYFPIQIKSYQWLKEQKCHKFVTSPNNAESIYEIKKKPDKLCLIIGSEAHGVSKEILSLADKKITIPQHKDVESLNVAVATAICIYEFKRKTI